MAETVLQVNQLRVCVEEKEILHGINLTIGTGETHVLMGPNGAGKSTLGYALMGNPRYAVTGGSIWFRGKDMTEEAVDKRAKEGLFLSFQNPLEVPGLSLGSFIRGALEQRRGTRIKPWEFRKELNQAMALLQMEESYAQRDLNVGFSGGEKKKAEILQLLMMKPDLAVLDETDSGLDVDAVRTVSRGVEAFQREKDRSLLIITHSTRILEALHVDYTHIMVDGRIVKTGDASLVEEINEKGFEEYLHA
ncbi:MAG TPA: Fe-S cluster assembly ATPase SufC [Candidatus Fimimorpha excrementavium]|nr:Fe-S cluster assembly ATPase SufC [Candidatus Fimimorpha excrementavium]